MRTTPESQQALDLEIAKLEQVLAALKRRRNGLSPFSQLHTELICKIFDLSIRCPETDRDLLISIRPERTRLSICHVSLHWRTVALEWPKLWSAIHIRDNTKVEYLDLVRKRAKDLPLSIDFYGKILGYTDGTVLSPGVRHIFQVETERLTSVVLSAPIKVLRSLLPKIKACSNAIQFLKLEAPHSAHGWTPVDVTQMDTFCNFPNLRYLEIANWNTLFIPPASFNPTSLTALELVFRWLPAVPVIHAVFASLRNVAQQLTSLSLGIVLPPHLEDASLDIAGTPPINLSSLETIGVLSNGGRILSEIFSVLCIPSSIRTVAICAQQGASSQDVSLTLHHACANIPSPRFLQIDDDFDPSDGTYEIDVCASKYPPSTPHSNAHNAVMLAFFAPPFPAHGPPGVEPYTFPIPLVNPANWLFSALHHILVTCPFPAPFWKALASVPTLRVIEYQVTKFEDGFYRALDETLASGQVRTFYPSLNAIGITFEGEDLVWDVGYAERLAILLLRKHQGMGPPHFEWIDFKGCSSHMDADTLRLLFSVSKSVCWYRGF
ncbi:hypothetical protein DFP72DRAFT_533015 [Ephemerocybe angulata]|uniref:F-box domain-containing protein n=1 Tax=Ephemerocybe angulata TaxID=980116 RepID=A0A8H6M0L1_9AGAR|nr:hypothetical protein DFP72DRAFT_533015 [Tulosesus angulatus]